MIHIQITDQYASIFSKELIHTYIQKTIDYLDVQNIELCLVIETNEAVHTLNKEYRHIDAPTDVLSFVYNTADPETNSHYIGDIIISGDKVIDQAERAGHKQGKELCILVVHGILHLCGYDHEAETEEAVMLPLQEKILEVIYSDEF